MTPTQNQQLAHRWADFGTLWEALDYAAQGETGFDFYSARGQLVASLPYADLRERAVDAARGLVAAGLPRGSTLVLVADTDPDFMVLFLACQYAGILPAPVAVPTTLGSGDAYVATLRRQIVASRAAAAVAPADLGGLLARAAEGLDLRLAGAPADVYALDGAGAALRPFRGDEPCYLQYSSGSTRFPLGVEISQAALAANCRGITTFGLRCRPGDRCASWLPLYHDMGLVGFMLAPLTAQLSVDYLPTREFVRRPLTWLDLLSRRRGTLAYSPTFGYELCVRRARDASALSLDLSSWRVAGIGGDMIQAPVLARFAETFAPQGFRADAFVPSYGMAETAVAVSFAPLDRGFEVDAVDRRRLSEVKQAAAPAPDAPADAARSFVLCGRPLPGHEVEIRDDQGRALPDRRLGTIHVRGPSVMTGYFGEPEATRAVLAPDGWLDTGDLGYRTDGSLIVTGRIKDLIIVNGRNIWPQDLEWRAETLPGLRRGDVAAFSVETAGTGDGSGDGAEDSNAGGGNPGDGNSGDGGAEAERVVVLVQCRIAEPAARAALAREVAGLLQRTLAVSAEVVLVPPHGLPQTSSGKLSRSRAKANYLAGLYQAGPAAAPRAAGGGA